VQYRQPVPNEKCSDIFRPHAHVYFILLLAFIALFHLTTIRKGHVWGDDYAMYIAHAKNIVAGHPYADTGYIFNPALPLYSPTNYPPVFPLLLAPLYKLFGMNLMPMKVEQVIFFLSTLALVYTLWHRELGTRYVLVLIAILGLSPIFWSAKDNVLSDLPFLFFFYLVVVLARWTPLEEKQRWIRALLLGGTVYLSIGTRTIGMALMPGLLLYDVLQCKRIRRFTGVAISVCIIALLMQTHFAGAVPGSYLGTARFITPATLLRNLLEYSRVLAGFWVASEQNWFSYCVLSMIALPAILGMIGRWRLGFTVVECLLFPYLAIVLLFPFRGGVRYVYAFLPWIGFLIMSGVRELGRRFHDRYSLAPAVLLLLIAVPFLQKYRTLDFGPIREGDDSREFHALCDAVREKTGPEDVLIYYRARALSLYTERRTSAYNYDGTEAELWQWSHHIGATYLVTTTAFSGDGGFLHRFTEKHSDRLAVAYQNPKFTLYRISAPLRSGSSED
jgi:hypothetical protein